MAPVKRTPLLARALLQLDRPVRWIHLGAGPDEPEVRRILQGSEHVDFDFRGHVPHEEVLQFFRETPASVFVNVSDREGIAVSICEALSFDIPAVATAAGGSPEFVGRDYGTGVLVPLDAEPEAIAVAIAEVLAADRAGFAPREEWERRLNAEHNARAVAEWLLESKEWIRNRSRSSTT